MALKKSEKRLLIVLGAAVAVFLLDQFVLGKSEDKDNPQPPVQQSAAEAQAGVPPVNTPAAAKTASVLPVEKKSYETWGRDPFIKPSRYSSGGTSGTGPSRPVLKGMFSRNGRAYVLIDDVILAEGEEKDGIRVDKIKGTEVLCRKGSRSYTLSWRESS